MVFYSILGRNIIGILVKGHAELYAYKYSEVKSIMHLRKRLLGFAKALGSGEFESAVSEMFPEITFDDMVKFSKRSA